MKMKFVAILVVLVSTIQVFAQTSDSRKYNLLASSIDDQAIITKALVVMGSTVVNYQIAVAPTDTKKICFHVGSLLERAIGSAVRFEIHAVDQAQKARGQRIIQLAVQASTFCGLAVDEVLNAEYLKIASGLTDLSKIESISTTRQLFEVVSEIQKLAAQR